VLGTDGTKFFWRDESGLSLSFLGSVATTAEVLSITNTGDGNNISGTTMANYFSGVMGENTASGNFGYLGGSNEGIAGISTSVTGVYGQSISGDGVYDICSTGTGVRSVRLAGGDNNYADNFSGNVHITGVLSIGGGAFRIDHPLDPENKFFITLLWSRQI
jgi:hypothetical protein